MTENEMAWARRSVAASGAGFAVVRRRGPGRRSPRAGRGGRETVPGMPPVVDPANLYSETAGRPHEPRGGGRAAAGVRPERQVQRRLRDRSRHAQGGGPLQGRHQSPARRPVVGPQDPLGHQQRRGPHRREPHAHRSHHRQARQGHRGGRSLQHVLHARTGGRRSWWRRRSSGWTSAIPTPWRCSGRCPRAELRRHQPRRLLHRRPLRHLHLRVPGQPGQDRPRRPQGAGVPQALQGPHAPGHPRLAGRQDLLRGRDPVGRRVPGGRRDLHRGGLHRHRRGLARALSQPRRRRSSTSSTGARRGCTGRRRARAAWRSSTSPRGRSRRPGSSPAGAARTWAMSAPTASSSGCPAATTTWST